jgi:hypothetical protein
VSYDLAVFDPRAEFRERSTFLTWFDGRTSWDEGLNYFDPSNATPALQAWYREIVDTFPPLNGPDRPANLELCTADFSIGTDLIYVGFTKTSGGLAYETMFRLATKHGVGFFDVSGNGAVWFPKADGNLEMLHEHQESDPPGRMARMMAEAVAEHGAVHVDTLENALTQKMGMLGDPKNMEPIVIGRKRQNTDDATG